MILFKQIKTLITPDFGVSDIWHHYLPYKFFYSQSLKNWEFPLWCPLLANGLPIFAQGQMGALNFINLLLFGLLDFQYAVLFFYLSTFLVALSGSFLFAKSLFFSNISSFFFAIFFSFSGFMISHLSHWDIFQSASFLPWELYLLNKGMTKRKISYFIFLSYALTQQFFTGGTQIVFISLISLFILFFSKLNLKEKKQNLKLSFFFLFSSFLTFLLSLTQFLPNWQYYKNSLRQKGLSYEEATAFPYPLKHFLTFWEPFYFGNPKLGTYPLFSTNWGIFWENTAYLGKIIIVLFIFGFFCKSQKNKYWQKKFALIMLFLSFFLLLGKNSPFYFIYTYFPFNLFRVPSRFLLLFSLAALIIAFLGLETLQTKFKTRFFALLILVLNFLDIFSHFFNYHPTAKFSLWLEKPQIVKVMEQKKIKGKVFSFPNLDWNNILLTSGWEKNIDDYLYLMNNFLPNFNLLFNISHILEHNSFPLKNNFILTSFFSNNASFDKENKKIKINPSFFKTLQLYNVQFIISPFKIDHPQLQLIKELASPNQNLTPFHLYEVKKYNDWAKLFYNYRLAETLVEYTSLLSNDEFDPERMVILNKKIEEIDVNSKTKNDNFGTIKTLSKKNQEIILEVKTNSSAILVLADNYYPNWQVEIDKKKVAILTANLGQKAVIVPTGSHKIRFYYEDKLFQKGLILSSLSFLISLFLLFIQF